MNEDNDDLQPLLGAVGPYLSTGPTNPVEDEDETEDGCCDYTSYGDSDFWEDDEQ